ncbi:MAG TPA: C45 family peptidase [Gaiellaceae bacterium]|nr:C45 family peptidase [Gaiellaceae bacterium]
MSEVRIPLIEVSGGPRERGRQHGEAARDRILLSIEAYRGSFSAAAGLDWDQVCELAPQWLPLVEAYNGPELVEELHGIAEGAGVTLGDVLALNGRGDLSYTNPFAAEECSAWAILDEASPDGHVYCGQNWDWRLATQETVIMLRIEQPGKPTIVMQTEAGQIGRQGANSSGLALNATGLGPRWGKGLRLPQPYIRRRILDSWTMNEALEASFRSSQSVSSNLLLTHRDGFAIDIESTPGRHGWGYPTDGVIVHTNHFVYFVPPQIEGTYRPAVADSLIRLERIQSVLRRVGETRSGEELRALVREAMTDHFSYPNSVCNHPDEREPEADRMQTVASTIVDLTTGEYRLSHGPPCANDYELLPWNLYAEAPVAAAA